MSCFTGLFRFIAAAFTKAPRARSRGYERFTIIKSKRESQGEKECRRVVEMLFGKPFPTKRPNFLKNPETGASLEIDCYCEELKLAIEYNGKQHYHRIPHFHPTEEVFHAQIQRDELKVKLCRENSVELVIVPYTVKVKNIEGHLKRELASRLNP